MARLAETDTAVAHCPASNLFLSSGAMPLSHYLAHGIRVGLGSDVSAGPELSIFANMRPAPTRRAASTCSPTDVVRSRSTRWTGCGWRRWAARAALGLQAEIGSLEPGKEADMIAVDPRLVAPVDGIDSDDPAEIMSRLAFRPHPDMVRLAWVRGRALDGPPGIA